MTVIGLMFPESLKSSLCSRLQQNICTVRSVRFQRPVLSVRFSSCEFYHLSSQKQIFPLHPYVASLFTHIVKHKSDIIHWFLKIESMNRNSSSLGFLIIKTGCQEKKWSHYPWRCSRTVEMSHWVTWVSGHSGDGLIVRPHYPSGIFQPKCFYSSVILWKEIFWVSKLAWDCSNIVHLCTVNGWITICRLFCSDPFLDPYHPQWGARKREVTVEHILAFPAPRQEACGYINTLNLGAVYILFTSWSKVHLQRCPSPSRIVMHLARGSLLQH